MPMSFGGVSKQKVATIIVAADGSGDTPDIQTGINLLPAAGGVVYVKEGTYVLSATVTITDDNVELTGAGKSTIIRYDAQFQQMVDVTNTEGTVIQGVNFHNEPGDELSVGLRFNGCSNGTIRGCWFEDIIFANSLACVFTGSDNCTFLNNFVTGCAVGIEVSNSDKNIILGNQISATANDVWIESGSGNIVVANELDPAATIPLRDEGTDTEIGHNVTT